MGRKKIEIAKIADANARQVCFSKRRGGLFKKASELSILCGAEIAVVVFSQAGKVFSFGSPNVDYVVDKHLHLTEGRAGEPPNLADYVDAERLEGLPALEQTYNGINEQLIAEKDRETSLKEEGKVLGVDQGQGQQPNDGSFCFWWQLYDADNDDVGGLQDKLNRLDNDYNILSRHLQIAQQQNAMALQQQQAQHQNYGFENPDLFQANYAPPNLEALSRMVPLPALQSGEENQASGSEVQLMNVAVGLLPPNGMMYSTMEYGNSRGGAYNLQETNDGNQMSLPGQYNAPAAGSRDSTSVMGLRETFSELHPPYDGSSLEGFPFKGNPSL